MRKLVLGSLLAAGCLCGMAVGDEVEDSNNRGNGPLVQTEHVGAILCRPRSLQTRARR
jgi:hypothetical protein